MSDYFARVRPLLGTGLSRHAIEVDDAELALLVLELLTDCMLDDVTVTQLHTRAAFDRYRAWKHLPPARRDRPADARIVARRGHPAVQWDGTTVMLVTDPDADPIAHADLSYHVARTLRDALLGRAPMRPPPRQPFDPRGIALALAGRHIAVVGCGSLGSEALRLLAPSGARFTLIDHADVTTFNLARQWFGAADVGRAKVDALRDRLGPTTQTWRARLDDTDLPAFDARLAADRPDLVVLATGTHHHAPLAAQLWRRGIPHVAACCYPRARYFEVSVHVPAMRTPCLHCFRGHLYRGAADDPVPDELASFLYAPMSDDERARRYTDLVAEPATRIETLRAALVLARCAVELLAPQTAWFARMLAEHTTCLLGGNASGAYGITAPGQVLRLGLDEITGTSDRIECDVCGRTLDVALRTDC